MSTCPFCSAPGPDDARDCAGCGARLVKRCPYCAEDIPLTAPRCARCKSDLLDAADAEETAATSARGSQPLPRRPLWADTIVVALLGLAAVTAIVAGFVHRYPPLMDLARRYDLSNGAAAAAAAYLALAAVMTVVGARLTFRIAGDINRHAGSAVLRPHRDALLVLATGGLWAIAVAIRHPNAFNDVERNEGVPSTDVHAVCVVLACAWLAPIGQLMLQDAMNRHRRLHAP